MMTYLLFLVLTLLLKGGDCETEIFAEVGSPVILPCSCSPQTVSPLVVWTSSKGSIWKMQKSGLQFLSRAWASRVHCPHSQFQNGIYSLHIKSVREEDAGLYSCILGLASKKTPVKTTIMLRVIKASVSPEAPILGQTVTVDCGVSPWPNGAKVQWLLNNSPYEPLHKFRRYGDDSNTAFSVMVTDNVIGEWTCVVSYKGKESRASALLDFKGIIQPPKDNTKIYATVGSAVRLPCVFSDDLTSSNILWERFHNKSTSDPALGQLPPSFSPPSPHISKWDRSAVVNEVSFEDKGLYMCSGNVQGKRLYRSMLLVTATVDVLKIQKKEATIQLTCKLSDPSDITEYEWVYVTSDLNGTQFIATVHKGKTVTFSPQSEGEWTCRFYGTQGLLGNVTYHIHQTAGLSAHTSGGFSQNTAVLVCLSLLLLVLLLTLAQMYRNHQRRKRTFQYPALETIIHTISVERELRANSQVKN